MTKDTGSPASYDEMGEIGWKREEGEKCASGAPPLHPLSSQRKALPLSWPSCVKSPRCPLVQARTRSKIAHAQRGWFPQTRKHGERNNSLGRLQHTLAIRPAPVPLIAPPQEKGTTHNSQAHWRCLAQLQLITRSGLYTCPGLALFGCRCRAEKRGRWGGGEVRDADPPGFS